MKHADLVSALPEDQREEVKRRIAAAEAAGWTAIGLWTADDGADIVDLVGVPRSGPRRGQVTTISEDPASQCIGPNGDFPERLAAMLREAENDTL